MIDVSQSIVEVSHVDLFIKASGKFLSVLWMIQVFKYYSDFYQCYATGVIFATFVFIYSISTVRLCVDGVQTLEKWLFSFFSEYFILFFVLFEFFMFNFFLNEKIKVLYIKY